MPSIAEPEQSLFAPCPSDRMLFSGGLVIAANTGWAGAPEIAAGAGAFCWGAAPTADSALLVTLPPGAYTAEVAGATADTGLALIEVYAIP